jgi:hypothetical protein
MHGNMGLDVLIWGFGIAVFGVAARRAFDMITQERWRATWIWFFASFVPLGAASQVWVAMNNPPPTARWFILGIAGAAFGATLFIAIGEALRPVSPANAQGSPPPAAQPPIVNQGPGSAYSAGQQGGVTAGTINIGPIPRRVSETQAALIQRRLTGVNLTFDVVIAGGTEVQQFARDIGNVLRIPGINITDTIGIVQLIGGWEGVHIYDPQGEITALRQALTEANIPISDAQNRPGRSPYPPKTPALIIGPQP